MQHLPCIYAFHFITFAQNEYYGTDVTLFLFVTYIHGDNMKISDAQRGIEGAIKLAPVYLFEIQFLIIVEKEAIRCILRAEHTYKKSIQLQSHFEFIRKVLRYK